MPGTRGPTFDRVGFCFIEPTYWVDEEQPMGLAKLLGHFLSPDEGQAWFRSSQGEWTLVSPENWEGVQASLGELVGVWTEGQTGEGGYRVLEEKGHCSIFLDAERFLTCVRDGDGLPDEFYVGFEIDWSPAGDAPCLTPHFRASNHWPDSDRWAPQEVSSKRPEALSPEQAATLLEEGLWRRVEDEFREVKRSFGLYSALVDLGDGQQIPPVFYYLSPVERLADADSYLTGEYLRALNKIGHVLLGTPDIRSIEVTGGVLEGCLAVFNHSPAVQSEYHLMIPLAGFDEAYIESRIHYVTDLLQFVDFDASRDIYRITTGLEAEEGFFALWSGSLGTGMELNDTIFSLLGKAAIQVRMFSLARLLSGFLVKLQARTYAGAKRRSEFRRDLEREMRISRGYARRKFTVRKLAELEMMASISDGYTRAYRAFEERIGKAADSADRLAEQIEYVGKSLSHTAGLEEQKRERERKVLQEREEKASKRLNLVLALVAVLAAIPLIVGQYNAPELATAIAWFPFESGLYLSFGIALFAFTATVIAIALTLFKARAPSNGDEDGLVSTVYEQSEALSDRYRSYGHARERTSMFLDIQTDVAHGRGTWQGASDDGKVARKQVHELDLDMARAVARSLDQSELWRADDQPPDDDEASAQSMESRVCRFVLLGDVFDLRPKDLRLPVTLCLYRFKYDRGGLGRSSVSDAEWEQVMNSFGYTGDELKSIEYWAGKDDIGSTTAVEFVDACVEAGITALHEETLTFGQVTHV